MPDLKKVLMDFAGYVLACRLKNQRDYMVGLAEQITIVDAALGDGLTYKFNGDGIVVDKAATRRAHENRIPAE